ncbi:MAG: PEP-CTERM sorting domain-containing protein [Phycisphaerae bacterium]
MKKFLAAGATLALTGSAFAGAILNETFDYADNASLNAAWNASASNPTYTLDTGFGNPAGSYMMTAPTVNFQGRLAMNIGAVDGTDAAPLRFSMDMYLADGGESTFWNGARHYVELRGYEFDGFGAGALQNLLALGVNNAADDGFNGAFYSGRVTFGSNWSSLNDEAGAPQRSAGWHNLALEIGSTSISFYVDGILAEVEARPNAFNFDTVVLGSDLTAAGWNSWVDNVRVEIVPEPASLSLLALGGLAMLRRRG